MNNVEKAKAFLLEKPGYQKSSYLDVAAMLDVTRNDVAQAVAQIKNGNTKVVKTTSDQLFEEFLKWKQAKSFSEEVKTKRVLPKPFKGNPDNVLVIGDLHAPFIRKGYLEFCREEQEKWDCGTVIFIGDSIDGHSWSFHEHDADGMSVKDEVKRAKQQLAEWYEVFPVATVLYGNHDLLVARKAKAAGLSQHFIKDLGEIIGAPNTWTFTHEVIKDEVKYIHGSVGNAIKRAKDERISIVQGHLHTEAFTEWAVSERDAIFGLQVGCGIDHEAYAFEYARPFPKKPVISCGIVLEKGRLPFTKLMNL
jgi:hypothetical protein